MSPTFKPKEHEDLRDYTDVYMKEILKQVFSHEGRIAKLETRPVHKKNLLVETRDLISFIVATGSGAVTAILAFSMWLSGNGGGA